jgi:NAD(P)H dehydrogenase (quinone)
MLEIQRHSSVSVCEMAIFTPGPRRVAVTAANGAIGSQVVEQLSGLPGVQVVPIVRNLSRARRCENILPMHAPYEDRGTLTAALSGSDCLVFIGSDGEADRMLAQHANIIAAAAEADVRRTVLLSILDADPDSPFCYAHTYAITEQWARDGLPDVTILRSGLYSEFIAQWLWDAARTGVLSLPMGDARVAPVARSDVADLLTDLGRGLESADRLIELIGPESLDHDDLAGAASVLGSCLVRSEPCDAHAYAVRQAGHDEPSPWWAYAFQTLFAAIRENRFDHSHRTRAIGRHTLKETVRPVRRSADSPA